MVNVSSVIKGVLSPVRIACSGTTQGKQKEFSEIVKLFNSAADEFLKGKEVVSKKELGDFYKKVFPGLNIKLKSRTTANGIEAMTISGDKSITFFYPFEKGLLNLNTKTAQTGADIIKHETNHAIFYATKAKESIFDELTRAFKFRKHNKFFKNAYTLQSSVVNNNFYTNKIYSGNTLELSKEEALKMPGFVKEMEAYLSKNASKEKNVKELSEEFFKLKNIKREKALTTDTFRDELNQFFESNNISNYEKNIHLKHFHKSLESEKHAYTMDMLSKCKSEQEAKKLLDGFEYVYGFEKKLSVLKEERIKSILEERSNIKNGITEPKPKIKETFKPLMSLFTDLP